jgi:transposase
VIICLQIEGMTVIHSKKHCTKEALKQLFVARKIDYARHIYKDRNFVERFFNRIKDFRRIAKRYNTTAIMFAGSLILTGILIWLKV